MVWVFEIIFFFFQIYFLSGRVVLYVLCSGFGCGCAVVVMGGGGGGYGRCLLCKNIIFIIFISRNKNIIAHFVK